MNGPLYDESGRYVGRVEPDEGPQTIVGWIKEYIVWWLVGWTAFFTLVICVGLLFFL